MFNKIKNFFVKEIPEEKISKPEEKTFKSEEKLFNPEEKTFKSEEKLFNPEEKTFKPEEKTFKTEEKTSSDVNKLFSIIDETKKVDEPKIDESKVISVEPVFIKEGTEKPIKEAKKEKIIIPSVPPEDREKLNEGVDKKEKPIKNKKSNSIFNLLKMNADISKKTGVKIQILGLFLLFGVWFAATFPTHTYDVELQKDITSGLLVSPVILPSPQAVVMTYPDLVMNKKLLPNMFKSIKLNVLGYLIAILITIPLGFLVALFPFFRNLIIQYVNTIRFIPLTAVVVLFIAWFGMYIEMKVLFLAFGIIIYLLPVVINRVYETRSVSVDSVWTLGATNWQLFRHVYFPSAMSKIFEDIIVITALSWTYIVVVELINGKEGGLATLIQTAARGSRSSEVFAIVVLIMLIGFLQDKLLIAVDKKLFKYKYAVKTNRV